MRMDVSRYLATESFSFSWLPPEELKPSNSSPNNNNFDFDVSNSSNSSLVDADKLFSNGLIKPRHPYSKRERVSYYSGGTSPGSVAVFPSPSASQPHSAPKLNKVIRRIFSKYMGCLLPVGETGIRVDDVNRKAWEVKSLSYCTTPQPQSPIRRESDETSIHEAILYCKRSSGSGTSLFP